MAILYLDLDRFKAVNDTLGHPAGDRLLCQVADRLRASVRETEIVTRLGGDEFAVAQTGVEAPADVESLARRVIDTLSRPYDINGQWAAIGVSIGITMAGTDDVDVDQLLRRADMALYAASVKAAARGAFSRPQWKATPRPSADWRSTCGMRWSTMSWSYTTRHR